MMTLEEKKSSEKSRVERYTSSLSLITHTFPVAGFSVLTAVVLSVLSASTRTEAAVIALCGSFIGALVLAVSEALLAKKVSNDNLDLTSDGLITTESHYAKHKRTLRTLYGTFSITSLLLFTLPFAGIALVG